MTKQMIRFTRGGGVRKIAAPSDVVAYGEVDTKRASHVEPLNLLLRLAFHCIRVVVSDESKAAEFTRCWNCRWRARIFDPRIPKAVLGPFVDRQAAIDAEVDYITRHWILEGTQSLPEEEYD